MGFQITSFSLVVEGKWRTSTQSAEANCGRLPNSPVAWSTLLKGLVFKKEPSNLLSYYVHFQIQHASCFKNLVWPSRETCTSNPSWLRKFNQIEGHDNSWKGRQFEILMVTHKHPVRLKVHQTSSISLPLSSRLTSQNFPSLSIGLSTSMSCLDVCNAAWC